MFPNDTTRLLSLIERRYDLIRDLVVLTDTQALVSTSEDASTTLGILARKDTLIDQLRQINTHLEPYRGEDPNQRVWPSRQHRQRCQEIAEQSDQLLKEIIEMDEQTIQAMQRSRDAVSAQLRCVEDSLSAQRAYSAERQLSESVLDVSDL